MSENKEPLGDIVPEVGYRWKEELNIVEYILCYQRELSNMCCCWREWGSDENIDDLIRRFLNDDRYEVRNAQWYVYKRMSLRKDCMQVVNSCAKIGYKNDFLK